MAKENAVAFWTIFGLGYLLGFVTAILLGLI
jgi:hypothetical protein